MIGRSQAGNLSGMLTSIGDTIGEMGEPGKQYVDTFRRSMAPEVDLNSSDSLLAYSEWAKRNGYDDEAEKYLALGYQRKAVEGEKAYKTRVAGDSEKLRGFNESIGNLEREYKIASDQESPKAAYIETALSKVKDARRTLVTDLNDFGDASDFGVGNEGGEAVRSYRAEILASEKAALEREKTLNELRLAKIELADKAAESQPIPLSSLPPALQEQYQKEVKAALDGPSPASQMGRINERFLPIAQGHLESLASGDKATTNLLWQATANIRGSEAYGDDVKKWIRDHPEQVASAIETAEATLTRDSEYRTSTPEKRKAMVEEALMQVLRGQFAAFDDVAIEEEEDLARESAGSTARAGYKERDRVMQYKPGFEQGGAEYKKQLARAQEGMGEEFDFNFFNERWDEEYWSPGGAISPTSATGSILRKGPY